MPLEHLGGLPVGYIVKWIHSRVIKFWVLYSEWGFLFVLLDVGECWGYWDGFVVFVFVVCVWGEIYSKICLNHSK